jgi:hypothetical protein
MGLIERVAGYVLGGGTARLEDAGADLALRLRQAGAPPGVVLSARQQGSFNRVMDGLNRLPRPLMALGTIALLGAAVWDPVWFSARMEALAAMPEAAWWLIGAVVSLYFGGRLQAHDQAFQREMVETLARLPRAPDAPAEAPGGEPRGTAPDPGVFGER